MASSLDTMDDGPTDPLQRPLDPDQGGVPGQRSETADEEWHRSWASRRWGPADWSLGTWQYRTGTWDARTGGQWSYATLVEASDVSATRDGDSNAVVEPATDASPGTDPWAAGDPWSNSTSQDRSAGESSADWGQGGWRSWGWSDQPWSGQGWRQSDWWGASWQNASNKPDYADPPTWPGWSHRRLWVQAIRRWDKQTDIPTHKRAEKLLRTFGWEMQVDFGHLSGGPCARLTI